MPLACTQEVQLGRTGDIGPPATPLVRVEISSDSAIAPTPPPLMLAWETPWRRLLARQSPQILPAQVTFFLGSFSCTSPFLYSFQLLISAVLGPLAE